MVCSVVWIIVVGVFYHSHIFLCGVNQRAPWHRAARPKRRRGGRQKGRGQRPLGLFSEAEALNSPRRESRSEDLFECSGGNEP